MGSSCSVLKYGFYDGFLYQYLTHECIIISDDHGLLLTSPPVPANPAWVFVRTTIVTLDSRWNASITNATRYEREKESIVVQPNPPREVGIWPLPNRTDHPSVERSVKTRSLPCIVVRTLVVRPTPNNCTPAFAITLVNRKLEFCDKQRQESPPSVTLPIRRT